MNTKTFRILVVIVIASLTGCENTSQTSASEQSPSSIVGAYHSDSADLQHAKHLKVSGVASLTGNSLETLEVNGVATLHNVTVQNTTTINGMLTAQGCSFDTIEISTQEMVLSDCSVRSIMVRPTSSAKAQVVTLSGTTVAESITFEQGNGMVVAAQGSVVQGSVIGGKQVSK